MDRRSLHRRRALIVLGTVALLAGTAGCGASGGDQGSSTSRPPTTAEATTTEATTTTEASPDHQATLADHETPGIASQLSEVPGYTYVDVSSDEIEDQLGVMHAYEEEIDAPDLFRAASFHGVVADDDADNTAGTVSGTWEAAFLVLHEFSAPIPVGMEDDVLAAMAGGVESDRFTASGTEVRVVETPDTPDSRFHLAWLRHGVLGVADGADREPVERFVRAYLAIPEREPEEDDLLAAQLVGVEGFAYTNVWDDDLNAVVDGLLDEGPSSTHAVVDESGAVGVLWMVDLGEDLDDTMLAAEVAMLTDDGMAVTEDHGGTSVARGDIAELGPVWGWSSDGVLHVLVAGVPDAGEAFLDGYLAQS